MKYALLLFILLVKFSFSQQLNYSLINTSHGLPSSEVYAILQDKQGYMWFATNLGVSRYDGKKNFTYTTANGLLDNTVFRMCEDKEGRIWFGSQSNELCYWQNGRIHRSPFSDVFHKHVLPYEIIRSMYCDSTNTLWVNTIKRIFTLRQNKDQVEFHEIADSISGVRHLIAVENKKVMYAARNVYPESKTPPQYTVNAFNFLVHAPDEKPYYVSVPFEIKKVIPYAFFVAAITKDVYLYSTNEYLFIVQKGKQVQIKKLPHPILNMTIDRNNDLWIGYYKGGVECYRNCDLNSVPFSLSGDYSIDDICQDHEGGVWLATLESGVIYIPSSSILDYSNIAQLNDRITNIGKIQNGIYVTTFGNRTFRKDMLSFTPDMFINNMGKQFSQLYSFAVLRDTTYLSFSSRVVRLDRSFRLIPTKEKTNKFVLAGKTFFETADHRFWLFYGGGLKEVRYQNDSAISHLSPHRSTCAVPVGKHILIGGKKGLYLFKDGKYEHLEEIDTLLKSSITDMAKARDGSIWLSTIGNGVLQLKDNKVSQLTQKNGLISNICTSITTDDKNNIWVGSNNGISCIVFEDKRTTGPRIKNITKQYGLNAHEITRLFASGDSLWVGSMSGLSSVYIPGIINPLPSSPVYISEIRVNNNPINHTQTLFPYHENNLRFFLHGLTFKDHGNHLFRYRLIGLDTTWHETNFDELLFNNLNPGNYQFEVQVANSDKIWSSQTGSYSFTIEKPFWLTWWFIVIEIITAGLIVYLIILWRTFVIRKKEQEKLRINKLLTEYQMKALTAQMNPHFIFNAINSIQNFIIQNHSTLAYDYLIKFSKLIRLVLNNSNEKEISIQQELDTLAIYVELEQLRFKESFDYELQVDPDLELDSLMIPSLLLQPYIENAIWHGLMPLKTHKGKIILSIQKGKELLNIRITDNGVGRTISDQLKKKIKHAGHRSVGMELTGKRIELFGHDQQFSIQIIDNYDDKHNSTGTTVQIVLPMLEMY